jgi:hypothetical protein
LGGLGCCGLLTVLGVPGVHNRSRSHVTPSQNRNVLAPFVTFLSAQTQWLVQPYYVYPADQPYHKEYAAAIDQCTKEIQDWYRQKAGLTFRLAPLRVVKSSQSYREMRGSEIPPEGETSREKLMDMPNWWPALEKAVRGWKQRQVSWVFAQGGGGIAQANLVKDWQGMGIFGDWVLEPISGVREPKAIHAGHATWEVKGGTPKGTTAHELGHAFGLHHPDNYEGKSIMRAHWDYPDTGLLPHEILILKNSPFFVPNAFDESAPHLDFENQDIVHYGETLHLTGRGFKQGDLVEFVSIDQDRRVAATLDEGKLVVTVPQDQKPGFIRVRRGKLRSNIVPVNVYKPG